MPVNSPHRDYANYLDRWTRCRDAHGGSDAVKARTIKYLPLLEGHTSYATAPYIGYLMRAMFYPAMERTVAGLSGLVFAKLPTVAGVPKSQQPVFDDVTLTGVSLGAFGLALCHEALITGRVGTLVDLPDTPMAGARPYWSMYLAENIINWRVERINGKQVLTLVVLAEEVEQIENDLFQPKRIMQWRVLQLIQGVYTVTVYREDEKKKGEFIPSAPRTPIRRGERMNFIPFTFLGAENVEVDVTNPPLLPLVDVNLSHYRTSADHEHGAHYTALPTPYVTGHELKSGETLTIGSGQAWVMPNPVATAGMLEFSGAGLASLAALKEEKRLLMATLGARMLETEKNTAEAAQTVRLRHAGESSAMSVLSSALGQALTQSIRWHLFWAGLEPSVADLALVTMNPDVMDELTSEDAVKLTKMWQDGAISKKTLHYNLEWGEWTRPGVTFEEEEAAIKEDKTGAAA